MSFVLEGEPLEASVHGAFGLESVNDVGRGRGHLCGRPDNPAGGHGRGHRGTCHRGTDHGRGPYLSPSPGDPCLCLCPSRRRTSTWWAGASLATETAVNGETALPSYSASLANRTYLF